MALFLIRHIYDYYQRWKQWWYLNDIKITLESRQRSSNISKLSVVWRFHHFPDLLVLFELSSRHYSYFRWPHVTATLHLLLLEHEEWRIYHPNLDLRLICCVNLSFSKWFLALLSESFCLYICICYWWESLCVFAAVSFPMALFLIRDWCVCRWSEITETSAVIRW